jgi:hypothetical protein
LRENFSTVGTPSPQSRQRRRRWNGTDRQIAPDGDVR